MTDIKYYFQLGIKSIECSELEYELRKKRVLNQDGFCYEYQDCFNRVILSNIRIVKTTIEKLFIEKPFPEADEFSDEYADKYRALDEAKNR